MEYEINVAKLHNGRYVHYFRVTVPYGSVKKVYEELKEKFPDCRLDVTAWQKTGREVNMDECNF